MLRGKWLLASILTLGGCASTTVMPVAGNTIELTAYAAPVCGAIGAERVASRDAAIATIRYGFDGYEILDGQARDTVRVVGYTPVIATTTETPPAYGSGVPGQVVTTYSGGYPIIGGSHDQAIVVRMFHVGDVGAQDAISARGVLGPNWPKIVAKGFPMTCLG